MTIYVKTATKSPSGKVYAFGRDDKLDGKPTSEGGYQVWRLCENYAGHVRGGIAKTWRYVDRNMSFEDAIELLNKKVKHVAFKA